MLHAYSRMRMFCILLVAPLLAACGGRALNKNSVQDLIVHIPESELTKEDVYIDSVSQTGERDMLVEARLRAALLFEREGGKWVIKQVKLGHGTWVDFAAFQKALQEAKIDETRALLEKVAAAIESYRDKNGHLPEFSDYVSLSNVLNPLYLTPLIRLDAWKNPLEATHEGANTIKLMSAGPDGRFGTADDVVLTRTFQR